MAYTLRIDNKKAAFALTGEEYSIWMHMSKTKPRQGSAEAFEVMWSDAIS